MITSVKKQKIVAICGKYTEKCLDSKENFGTITGVAFLSLAFLLFLHIVVI